MPKSNAGQAVNANRNYVNPSKKINDKSEVLKDKLTLSHDELSGIMNRNKSLGLLNEQKIQNLKIKMNSSI